MVTNYLVGTGGWAYFNVPGKNSLEVYAQVFNFTEVNYTFYNYPSKNQVEGWRRKVPDNFTFGVRCHQDLTHHIGLRPVEEAYTVIDKMVDCCSRLKAPFLVLETPVTYTFGAKDVQQARDLFSTVNLSGVRLVWEMRASLTNLALDLMRDFNIVHCVDLSKKIPNDYSDVVYSRLFGKGKHNLYQFTDSELVDVNKNALTHNPKTVALSFHGARMHSDAARFKGYQLTGKFMQVTLDTGVNSARAVLAEDATFPASKAQLIDQQGWKVIDITANQRVHLSQLLNKIPDCTYSSINDVVNALEPTIHE